jgi:anti-sigma regulatory factor (Ser/Thr protein kinase)
MMHGTSLLRLNCPARPEFAKALRHAVAAFLAVLELDPDFAADVLTATGEALANAIEHAYAGSDPADIELQAEYTTDRRLSIVVHDRGQFIVRARQPNRGFGIRIVHAIANSVRIETDGGTAVHMEFHLPASNA